jgi:hypothetical protein
MASTYFVHGNAVTPAETPGRLNDVGGLGWTAVVGLRQGWGTTFQGQRDSFNWFHIPLPVPGMVNDVPSTLSQIRVFMDMDPGVSVKSVHSWDHRRDQWLRLDDLDVHGDFTHDFTPPQAMRNALSLSIGVDFHADRGRIIFRGVAISTV